MTKQAFYRQCLLTRGTFTRIAWVPSSLAIQGRTVEFVTDPGDSWKVVRSFRKLPARIVESRSRDYRTQRLASDI